MNKKAIQQHDHQPWPHLPNPELGAIPLMNFKPVLWLPWQIIFLFLSRSSKQWALQSQNLAPTSRTLASLRFKSLNLCLPRLCSGHRRTIQRWTRIGFLCRALVEVEIQEFVSVRLKLWINMLQQRNLEFPRLWRSIWESGAIPFTSDPDSLINPSFSRGNQLIYYRCHGSNLILFITRMYRFCPLCPHYLFLQCCPNLHFSFTARW